ncbi:MAG: hypothetical protein ABIK28_23480 [Planctomycetota bacterium]
MNVHFSLLIFALLLAGAAALSGCAELPLLSAEGKNGEPPSSPESIESPRPARENRGEQVDPPSRKVPLGGAYGPERLRTTRKGDRVLATVDGEEIRASDLYEVYVMDNPGKTRHVVEDLALFILVRKEATRLGVSANPEEVEKRINAMIREQQGRIAMNLDETLPIEEFVRIQYHMEMPAYRDLIRQSAVFQSLLERCIRYLELRVRRFQVGVILVNDPARADEIRKKLVKGANFEVLAKEHIDKFSGSTGGVLPPLPADMDYPVIKESLKLGIGEVSEVKETWIGKERYYRIVKLIDIIEPLQGTYAELESQVETSVREQPLVVPDLIQYWKDSLQERYSMDFILPGPE